MELFLTMTTLCLLKAIGAELVSKNDEFCIQNEEFCTQNDEFCTLNDELCTKNDELCTQNDEFALKMMNVAARKGCARLDPRDFDSYCELQYRSKWPTVFFEFFIENSERMEKCS